MLRIGVALDGMRAPAWAAWLLRAIRESDVLDLELALLAGSAEEERSAILFSAYEALDRKVFSGPGDALEQVDVSSALEGVATVQLPAPAVQEPLDVLVCLGTGLAPAEIPLTPRHGVWTLHLGDQHRYQGEPALF